MLTGVIAASCLFMGCQKKGNGRKSVTPQAAAENTTNQSGNRVDGADLNRPGGDISMDDNKNTPAPENKDTANVDVDKDKDDKDEAEVPATIGNVTSNDNTPVVVTPAVTSSGDASVDEPVKPTVTSADTTVATSSGDTTPSKPTVTSGDATTVTTTSGDATSVTTEVVAKACSEEMEAISSNIIKNINEVYKKISDKNDKTSQADRVKDVEAILTLCDNWEKQFVKESVTACITKNIQTKKDITVSASSLNDNACYPYGDYLKSLTGKDNKQTKAADASNAALVKRLKEIEFTVATEEAKELFNKNNTDWKMYLVDGKIKSSAKELMSILDVGLYNVHTKAVCTVRNVDEIEYSADTVIKIRITKISDLKPKNAEDKVQKGIDMALDLTLDSKSKPDAKTAKKAKATLSCAKLKANRISQTLLGKAIHEQITFDPNKK